MGVLFHRSIFAVALATAFAFINPAVSVRALACQDEVSATGQSNDRPAADDTIEKERGKSQPKSAGYEFEKPFRVEADGTAIEVESPGYACPTMADVDGDGVPDLVVGQFRDGNMMFFRNLAKINEPPRFAAGQWLMTEEDRAVVPGVW